MAVSDIIASYYRWLMFYIMIKIVVKWPELQQRPEEWNLWVVLLSSLNIIFRLDFLSTFAQTIIHCTNIFFQ